MNRSGENLERKRHALLLGNERDARRRNALPTAAKSDNDGAVQTCLKERFHIHMLLTCPLRRARVNQKEMFLNCRIKLAVKEC